MIKQGLYFLGHVQFLLKEQAKCVTSLYIFLTTPTLFRSISKLFWKPLHTKLL